MSAAAGAVEGALVDWINSFPTGTTIASLGDLSDGTIICKLLLDIDRAYFESDLSKIVASVQWIVRFQNLKKIWRALGQFYSVKLDSRLPTSTEYAPNLSAIARDGSRPELIKLVKNIITAAIQSDRREDYITKIRVLSPTSQTELMLVINQMMELDDGDVTEDETDPTTPRTTETEFRMEEEIARLMADKEATENDHKILKDRFSRLQRNHEELQSELQIMQNRLEDSGKDVTSHSTRQDPVIRSQMDQLQADVQKLEDIVTERENSITSHESTIKSLNRKVDELTKASDQVERLKDELDTSKHTVDKLKKEQNIMQHYKRKLESMPELERKVKFLEDENANFQKESAQMEEAFRQASGDKKLVVAYKKQIEKFDADHAELVKEKHRLEVEQATWKDNLSGAESQRAKDTEMIQNLELKVRELESGLMGQISASVNGDLESEINFNTVTKTDLKLQIHKLERENQSLKGGGGAIDTDNVVLKSLLDDQQRAKKRLEHDFIRTHGDKLALEAELNAIRSGGNLEGSEVVFRLRKNLLDRDEIVKDLRGRLEKAKEQLSKMNRELTEARSDLSMVGKDQLDALTELKSANSSKVISLREDLEEMIAKREEAEGDCDQQKTLLNKVLLEKDALQKKNAEMKDTLLEWERTNGELRASLAAMGGNSEGREGELEKRVLQLQDKLEDRREKMMKTREHIKKLNTTIKSLENQLQANDSASEVGGGAKQTQEEIDEMTKTYKSTLDTLRKENDMMTSAWYDVTSRLQTNTVSLSRRKEAPSGWLNKQRSALTSAMV